MVSGRMKKMFLTLITALLYFYTHAQPSYLLGGRLIPKDLNAVSDSLLNILDGKYTLTAFDILTPKSTSAYRYTDYQADKDVYVTILAKNDRIASVNVSGPYRDIFKIYQRMFAPHADIVAVEKLGKLPNMGICNKNVRIIPPNFSRKAGEVEVRFETFPEAHGNWRLLIEED